MSSTPPGWYHDPWRQAPMRWWDGVRWTEHISGWSGPVVASAASSVTDATTRAWARHRLDDERTAARWLRPLLVIWPLALAVSAASFGLAFKSLVDSVRDNTTVTPSGWIYVADAAGLVSIGLLIARMIWLNRAGELARAVGLPLVRSPIASAIGWLVPVINYWWPYQGVRDLFPDGERPRRRLGWWWACWVTSSVITVAAGAIAAFLPTAFGVLIVAVALVPGVVGAALEHRLVADVGAAHARLVGADGA